MVTLPALRGTGAVVVVPAGVVVLGEPTAGVVMLGVVVVAGAGVVVVAGAGVVVVAGAGVVVVAGDGVVVAGAGVVVVAGDGVVTGAGVVVAGAGVVVAGAGVVVAGDGVVVSGVVVVGVVVVGVVVVVSGVVVVGVVASGVAVAPFSNISRRPAGGNAYRNHHGVSCTSCRSGMRHGRHAWLQSHSTHPMQRASSSNTCPSKTGSVEGVKVVVSRCLNARPTSHGGTLPPTHAWLPHPLSTPQAAHPVRWRRGTAPAGRPAARGAGRRAAAAAVAGVSAW